MKGELIVCMYCLVGLYKKSSTKPGVKFWTKVLGLVTLEFIMVFIPFSVDDLLSDLVLDLDRYEPRVLLFVNIYLVN